LSPLSFIAGVALLWHWYIYYFDCINLLIFLALCDLPSGDEVSHELTEAEVTTLRMESYYADPATDRPAILSSMAKMAAARQQWIRTSQPTITEVLEQYLRMEDMPIEMVFVLMQMLIFTAKLRLCNFRPMMCNFRARECAL